MKAAAVLVIIVAAAGVGLILYGWRGLPPPGFSLWLTGVLLALTGWCAWVLLVGARRER